MLLTVALLRAVRPSGQYRTPRGARMAGVRHAVDSRSSAIVDGGRGSPSLSAMHPRRWLLDGAGALRPAFTGLPAAC